MTDTQKRMMDKLGLTEEDFKPKQTPEERIATLETATDDIVLMLADIIGGEE